MSQLLLPPQKERDPHVATDVLFASPTREEHELANRGVEAGAREIGVVPEALVEQLVASVGSLFEAAVAAELEEASTHFDPDRHPRWPAGTAGGLGGQFMRVGQRFSWKGVEYDVAAVFPGHIFAHVATKGIAKKPATIEIPADALEGGHPVISGVTRPPATPIHGAKELTDDPSFTGTVVDPYVYPETHDPSIKIPAGSKVTDAQWQRFGKLDQERYAQVMEMFGPWSPGSAQGIVDKILAKADPTARALLKANHDSQIGSSSGLTLSLHSVYGSVQHATAGSPQVEAARTQFENGRALQDEVAGALQWDLYNRAKGPDIAIFHRNTTQSLFEHKVINGKKPVFSGLSQSQKWSTGHNTGFGSNTFATPMAIRLIVMSRDSANVNKSTGLQGELEVATADAYAADARSVAFPSLSSMQSKWLTKITQNGAPGDVLEALKQSFIDSGQSLPVPPADPVVIMDGSAKLKYIEPPKSATVGAGKFGYSDVDADGVPIAKPAKDLALKPGDYVEGMQGTRYLIVSDPSYSLGVSYYKVTDQGVASGPKTPYAGEIHDANTGNQAFANHADWTGGAEVYQFAGTTPGMLPFKKLAAHYDLPIQSAEFKSDFHPEAWAFSAKEDAKMLGQFQPGEMFHLDGTYYKVLDQLGGGQTRIQNQSNGALGKVNSDYKSVFLVLKPGYSPTGQAELSPDDFFKGQPVALKVLNAKPGDVFQVAQTLWKVESGTTGTVQASQASGKTIGKLHDFDGAQLVVPLTEKPFGWSAPEVGDTLAVNGKKATVTKILKNGDVQLNLAPGVLKVKQSDPLLAGVFSADKWQVGDKLKLAQLAAGSLFHGGSGQKVKPYIVVAHVGKQTTVKNLDTGEESVVSSGKSFASLMPKVEAGVLAPTTETQTLLPPPPQFLDQFDPSKWEVGQSKQLSSLIPGDIAQLSGKPYKVEDVDGDLLTLKNLVGGNTFKISTKGASLGGMQSVPTLQAKGLAEQATASPVAAHVKMPGQPVLPSQLAVGDIFSTGLDAQYQYEVTSVAPAELDDEPGAMLGMTGLPGTQDAGTHYDQSWTDAEVTKDGTGPSGWKLLKSVPKDPKLVGSYMELSAEQVKPSSVPKGTLLKIIGSDQPVIWEKVGSGKNLKFKLVATLHGGPLDDLGGLKIGESYSLHDSTSFKVVKLSVPTPVETPESVTTFAGPGSFDPDEWEPTDMVGTGESFADLPKGTVVQGESGNYYTVLGPAVAQDSGAASVEVQAVHVPSVPDSSLHSLVIAPSVLLTVQKLKAAPVSAPQFATAFSPLAYDEEPGYEFIGDYAPGEIFKGKTGAYMQVTKVKVPNVYAVNLATGKATKLAAKIKPAATLVPKKPAKYEDLQAGMPVQLGELKVGDQFTTGIGDVPQLAQVLALADPNEEKPQVTFAPVMPDGSLGNPSKAGHGKLTLVLFAAHAADVKPPTPAEAMPPPLDVDSLPELKAGAVFIPYAYAHSGKTHFPKIKEMPVGTIFQDKDGQPFKVLSPSSGTMAVTDGKKQWKIDGELRGKVLDPTDLPAWASVLKHVPTPPVTPTQVEQQLVAPKLKPNTEDKLVSQLGLGVGDWVKFGDDEPVQITDVGGLVAGKPTVWQVKNPQTGATDALGIAASPSAYWSAEQALQAAQVQPVEPGVTHAGAFEPTGALAYLDELPVGSFYTNQNDASAVYQVVAEQPDGTKVVQVASSSDPAVAALKIPIEPEIAADHSVAAVQVMQPAGKFASQNLGQLEGFTKNVAAASVGDLGLQPGDYFTGVSAVPGDQNMVWQIVGPVVPGQVIPLKVAASKVGGTVGGDTGTSPTFVPGYTMKGEPKGTPGVLAGQLKDKVGFVENIVGVSVSMLKPGDQYAASQAGSVFEIQSAGDDAQAKILWPAEMAGMVVGVGDPAYVPPLVLQKAETVEPPSQAGPSADPNDYTAEDPWTTFGELPAHAVFQSMSGSVFEKVGDGATNLKTGAWVPNLLASMPASPLTPKGGPGMTGSAVDSPYVGAAGWMPTTATLKTLKATGQLVPGTKFAKKGGVFEVTGEQADLSSGLSLKAKVIVPLDLPHASPVGNVSAFDDGFKPDYIKPPASVPAGKMVMAQMPVGTKFKMNDDVYTVVAFGKYVKGKFKPIEAGPPAPAEKAGWVIHAKSAGDNVTYPADSVTASKLYEVLRPSVEPGQKAAFAAMPVGTKFKSDDPSPVFEKTSKDSFTNLVTGDIGSMTDVGATNWAYTVVDPAAKVESVVGTMTDVGTHGLTGENNAGWHEGQVVNVDAPGGKWSHVKVVSVGGDGVLVELPNISEPQQIPNEWVYPDPLVYGQPGGLPMVPKVGDMVTYLPGGLTTGPGKNGESDPAEVLAVAKNGYKLKFASDQLPFTVPKAWVYSVEKPKPSGGDFPPMEGVLTDQNVAPGDIVSTKAKFDGTTPAKWKVTGGSPEAGWDLELVEPMKNAGGVPSKSAIKVGTAHHTKSVQGWTYHGHVEPDEALPGDFKPIEALEPGSMFFTTGTAGVPQGTYQVLPPAAHLLMPNTESPKEGVEVGGWGKNLTTGKVHWFGVGFPTSPGGNVADAVKGFDFDPSGYEVWLPDTTLDMLALDKGSVVQDEAGDYWQAQAATNEGPALLMGLTGSEAGKVKTFPPLTKMSVAVPKKKTVYAPMFLTPGAKFSDVPVGKKFGTPDGSVFEKTAQGSIAGWSKVVVLGKGVKGKVGDDKRFTNAQPVTHIEGGTHPLVGYQYAHSGKKKYPPLGSLKVGTKFHDKKGVEYEVAEPVTHGFVKVYRTYWQPGAGTTLSTYLVPQDLRVFPVA